ncbi:hypothetical protein C8Q74DRAFT_1223060 [Fomes fomentarius]|nr:hypothetical protein C8Q74DRAFT_1223060 [Fomes fomentarius]
MPPPWNDDIIREILQHLSRSLVPARPADLFGKTVTRLRHPKDDELEGLHRRTLASAALTCKAFSEPASQELWAVLPNGLLPLMHTFSNLRTTYKTASSPPNYTLEGAIQYTEIQRFKHLAARVKYFAFGRTTREISPSALDVILEQFEIKNSPLFPKLRALEWYESSGDPHLSRLLGSLVRTSSLSAFIYVPNIDSTADMSLFAALRPQLRHLRVLYVPSEMYGICAPLIPLRSLVSIRVFHVDPSFFRHLATLVHLEDVETSLARKAFGQREPPLALPDSKTVLPGFKSLRRFATAGLDQVCVEDLVWMLSTIATSTRLSTLDMKVDAYGVQGVFPALQKIRDMPALRNLRTLVLGIYLDTYATLGIRIQLPFSDIASPFYTISSLEHISFSTNRILVLSVEDLTRIQEAWPRLKELSAFRVDSGMDYDSEADQVEQPGEPSLASVVAFTMKMKNLEVLDIDVANVSAEDVDQLCALAEDSEVGHEPPPQSQLQHLTFAMACWRVKFASEIDERDVDRLACALRRIFPRMRGVSSEWRRHEWWSEEDVRSGFYRLLTGLDQR